MIEVCQACGASQSSHCEPFSDKPTRTCDQARVYRACPDVMFCRASSICSVTKVCESQRKYGKACND